MVLLSSRPGNNVVVFQYGLMENDMCENCYRNQTSSHLKCQFILFSISKWIRLTDNIFEIFIHEMHSRGKLSLHLLSRCVSELIVIPVDQIYIQTRQTTQKYSHVMREATLEKSGFHLTH